MQYLDTLEGWLWAVLVAFLVGMATGEDICYDKKDINIGYIPIKSNRIL